MGHLQKPKVQNVMTKVEMNLETSCCAFVESGICATLFTMVKVSSAPFTTLQSLNQHSGVFCKTY